MTGVVLDADTGRVALTRGHLGALADHVSGRAAAPKLLADLGRVGAVDDSGVHPLLRPLLRTMATVRGRGVLRRWVGEVRPVTEILVGAGGVLVLPGGPDADVLQEVRWHPRPSAVARIVAELLNLPADDWSPPFDDQPRPWAELVAAASDPDRQIGLADLRWSSRMGARPVSVLVVAWRRQGGGIVEVAPVPGPSPADGAGTEAGAGRVRCVPRHPLEVWTGLTTLARRCDPPDRARLVGPKAEQHRKHGS